MILGESAGSKARLAVGSCLGTLAKFNLLKGSIAGAGLFTHDIVRDYAKSRCPELPTKQRQLLQAVLEASPAKGGWPSVDGVARQTVEWCVLGVQQGSALTYPR